MSLKPLTKDDLSLYDLPQRGMFDKLLRLDYLLQQLYPTTPDGGYISKVNLFNQHNQISDDGWMEFRFYCQGAVHKQRRHLEGG